jgi:glutamate---cysteine ligase / carboxylate-amine ligase
MPAALPLEPVHSPSLATAPVAVRDQDRPSLPTVGVEEEFLLLDRRTGLPVPVAGPVLQDAAWLDRHGRSTLQHEVLRSQVETATPVCHSLDEVAATLRESRRALALAAERHHVGLASIGAAPDCYLEQPLTTTIRYLAMHRQAAGLLDEQLINGMHVHVEVPSRAHGVQVLNRLRPYLHVLLAFSANSPMWRGRDSGFASWRAVHSQRWPVEGAPPYFPDAHAHDRHIQSLLRTGVVLDTAMVYWQARLSEQYPTVEVRVGDVALDVDGAVAYTGLVRGLIVAALSEEEDGDSCPVPAAGLLRAASWQAARYGLDGELVSPSSVSAGMPVLAPAASVVRGVAARAARHLGAEGPALLALVEAVLEQGNGAQRQRRAWAQGGLPALVDLVCEAPAR